MSKHSTKKPIHAPAAIDPNQTSLLTGDAVYIDWIGARPQRTGFVPTMAWADAFIAESASWEVPPLRGREWAQRVARRAIDE